MKLGIMQPYFFPYIGYFQLLNAVDAFVVYDDVNFIKQGWINRNYILSNGRRQLLTLQLNGASSFKPINQVRVGGNGGKLVKTIAQVYSKAPFFGEVFPVIECCLNDGEKNLAAFITSSLKRLAAYLEIKTKFMLSSLIDKDNSLKGTDRLLDICRILEADEYYNSVGGMELYSKDDFSRKGVRLNFIKPRDIEYRQASESFIPNLSIIDVLMFNSKDRAKDMLKEYELLG
jgi:hypothetical protein